MRRRLHMGTGLGRGFDLLFSGAVVSRFGDANRGVAIVLFAAAITRDPRLMSLVVAMSFLPWLLFGFVAGALVDRVDRRRAFLATDLSRAAVVSGVAVVAASGVRPFWVLPAAAFIMGSLQTVSDSCFNALLPAVVPRDRLPQANSRLSAAQSGIGRFAGLPAGAALFAIAAWIPFAVDAASFVVAAACVGAVRTASSKDAPEARRGFLRDVSEGLRTLWRAPRIRALVTTVAAMNLAAGAVQAVLALYALYSMGMGAVGYGWLTATSAGAMILGNLLAGRMQPRLDGLTVATVAVVAQIAGFAVTGAARTEPLLFAGVGLTGFTAGLWNVPSMSVLMAETEARLMGRVSSAYKTVALCTAPLGAAVGGVLGAAVGLRSVFALAAVLVGAAAALLLVQRRGVSAAPSPAVSPVADA